MKKRVVSLAKYVLIAVSLFAISFFIYLENAISIYVSGEQFNETVEWFKEAEKVPDSYFDVIKKYRPGYLERSPLVAVFKQRILHYHQHCPCEEVYVHPGFVNRYTSLAPYVVQLELQDRVGAEGCYNFLMGEFLEGTPEIKLDSFTQRAFSKKADELSEKEILLIDLFRQRSSYYREYLKNPDSLVKVVEERMGRQE